MDVGTRYLIEARVDKVGKKKERLHKIGKRRRQRINGGKGLIMDVDMGYIKTKRYTYNKENTKHTSQCYPKAEACGRTDIDWI